jgi:hypothetical protein
MIVLHVDPTTKNIDTLNKVIKEDKHVFILFYMEGCGPCNATRPEWKKMNNICEQKHKHNPKLVIADVDQELLKDIQNLPSSPAGFPTMMYINKDNNENYENSSVKEKDRSVDSFIEWIDNKLKSDQLGGGFKKKNKKTNKKQKRKWSMKYKKSINCKRPKGFSQKNYCKYGRKSLKRK